MRQAPPSLLASQRCALPVLCCDNADVRPPRSSRVEIIALDVYQRAEDAGQRITLELCEQRPAELRAHRPTCRCGLCGTMAKAKARNVFAVAASWQRWARAHDRAIVIATSRS